MSCKSFPASHLKPGDRAIVTVKFVLANSKVDNYVAIFAV